LNKAVEEERYELAVKVRDAIKEKKMENKIHRLKDLNDVVNLITTENAEFLIADLIDSFHVALSMKEKIKKETGEYPVDFLSHIDIVFDGIKGCNKITLNGKEVELIKE